MGCCQELEFHSLSFIFGRDIRSMPSIYIGKEKVK